MSGLGTAIAGMALLFAARAAQAAPAVRATKPPPAFITALQGFLRGPAILPNGAGVRIEGTTGVLRTLELDDTTSLHLRVHIPF